MSETAIWTGHGHHLASGTSGTTEQGFLVLADISGFTAFVTATELEHGPPIIAALLEAVIQRLAPPLDVLEIEGDAVFALGPDGAVVPPSALLGVLRGALAGFRELQRQMQRDESCTCDACRNIWRLRLKMIGHHGTFLHQTVGGRAQVAGKDVILAHRLLKNRLAPRMDYALLTVPALRHMGVDPARAGLVSHVEPYEHFGDVECYVGDLTAA
jgi:uncharacterized protein DUF2652